MYQLDMIDDAYLQWVVRESEDYQSEVLLICDLRKIINLQGKLAFRCLVSEGVNDSQKQNREERGSVFEIYYWRFSG